MSTSTTDRRPFCTARSCWCCGARQGERHRWFCREDQANATQTETERAEELDQQAREQEFERFLDRQALDQWAERQREESESD